MTKGDTPRVRLAILTKDEEHNIARAIGSAARLVDDVYIVDTGSTDQTLKAAGVVSKQHGLEFIAARDEWENFGENRSRIMRWAANREPKPDYIMVLDADYEVTGLNGLAIADVRAAMADGADMIELYHEGALDFAQPIFVKTGIEWYYKGVAHACLARRDGETMNTASLRSPRIKHHGWGRHGDTKFKRDRKLLEDALREDPEDPRSVFYLAQTYRDLGEWRLAIAYYHMRANMPGWDEETFWARYQLGCLLCKHVSFLRGARELLAAWEMRPHRNEPLRALEKGSGAVSDKIPYPESDRLFILRDCYTSDDGVS